MENLLIVGINTRPLANSAYHLGYKIYSASYFCTSDFNSYHHKKCILKQKPHNSCGFFQELYRPQELEELCSEWIDEIDHIIPYTGVSPQNFPSSKVLGNKNVESVENKFKLYKTLKKRFKVPETFLLSSLKEACEIQYQNPEKEYLVKPVYGSGGYGVFNLKSKIKFNSFKSVKNNLDENNYLESFLAENFILQEYLLGENVSASVISTNKEAKSLISSSQITGAKESDEEFIYCGNLTPLPGNDLEIKKTAEDIVKHLNLIGSNGVDMIINGDKINVIEVNPRFQGTFECAELSLGINMMDAHIKACHGELIKTPLIQKYCLKKILYASERSLIGKITIPGVYDIPLENTVIEKGEPVVTVIGSGKTAHESYLDVDNTIEKVKKVMSPYNV
jgi:predicted ATP-grasp superfamily ATP-dependent carboligase